MAILLAIPILGGLLILQTAVLNQMLLLQGTADLVLLAVVAWSIQKPVKNGWGWGIIGALMVGFVSAVPMVVFIISYLSAVGLTVILRQRIWSVPLLVMLISTFSGTLILQGSTMLALRIIDRPVEFGTSINLIVLPGLLVNLLLALPFYLVFNDLVKLLYPETLEM